MSSSTAQEALPSVGQLKLYEDFAFTPSSAENLVFKNVLFAICPTGRFCREDRCQSFFKFSLIPNMRTPLEECEAAGAIEAAGATAQVLDSPAHNLDDETFLQRATDIAPDLIVVVTTFGTIDADLAWVRTLKKHFPSVAIGLRGAPCYTHATNILAREAALNFCVQGEYEIIFYQIVRFGYQRAEGVTFRDGTSIISPRSIPRLSNLDCLPHASYSGIDFSFYTVRFSRSCQATVRVQRGCPYPCSYCLVGTVSGNVARHRSPRSIVSDVRRLMERGIRSFYFRADTFSLNKKWVLDLCDALRRDCPGIQWITTTRVERIDTEIAHAMAAAGCYGISFGVDVASEEIGRRVNKMTSPSIAQRAFDACSDAGIVSLMYLMIGFVWETKTSLKQTEKFLRSVTPDLVTIHFAHPYPGTSYYDDAMAYEPKMVSPRAQAEPALKPMQVTIPELESASRRLLFLHYRRPAVFLSLVKKFLTRARKKSFPTTPIKQ